MCCCWPAKAMSKCRKLLASSCRFAMCSRRSKPWRNWRCSMHSSWQLSALVPVLNAQLLGADLAVQRVCTDSRSVQQGDLFVALSGDNFDGHQFLAQAEQAGAVAAV